MFDMGSEDIRHPGLVLAQLKRQHFSRLNRPHDDQSDAMGGEITNVSR
jgi:hypothetical protein